MKQEEEEYTAIIRTTYSREYKIGQIIAAGFLVVWCLIAFILFLNCHYVYFPLSGICIVFLFAPIAGTVVYCVFLRRASAEKSLAKTHSKMNDAEAILRLIDRLDESDLSHFYSSSSYYD